MATAPQLTCYRHPNRETGVSCAECGRGLCPDCMVFTQVGIKCAEHAGVATGAAKVASSARRFGVEGTGALLTKILIGINVAAYLLVVAVDGTSLNQPGGELFIDGSLIGAALTAQDWAEAGRQLDAEWRHRTTLAPGVTTPEINALLAAAREAGALGGKVCGAGGGGCLFCLMPADKKAAVAHALTAGGAKVLECSIDDEGVRVRRE